MHDETKRKAHWLDRLNPDIFGSDVFVDYQGTYVWQANQVGHFAIGFGVVSLLCWLVLMVTAGEGSWVAYLLGVLAIVVYAGKEVVDLLIARRQAQGLFPYDEKELRLDMAADTWFVTSGALTALAAYADPLAGCIMAVVAVVAFLVIRRWFLPAKASLDRAALPYVYRLANFPRTDGVHRYNADRIQAFISGKPVGGFDPPPAVLIQGYRGTGKSTLGIGIASEVAVARSPATGACGRSLYFTAFNLFEPSAPGSDAGAKVILRRKPRELGSGDPWSIEDAEVLVIDDVDSDNPLYCGGTPSQVISHMRAERPDVLGLVSKRKSVWITGSTRFTEEDDPRGWKAWLAALASLYGCSIDESRVGDTPADIMAREPIPVVWLCQPLDVETV